MQLIIWLYKPWHVIDDKCDMYNCFADNDIYYTFVGILVWKTSLFSCAVVELYEV